ncbi:hypothetical protein [Aquimarina sp. AU474]|uniref:hypothetical protein n=1 Tax=Aquimarina sp. AU474 TaxID=2108529 RepID=UPI001357209A|nr:hypothetical protein [Aquimarina sp. AU474]
MKNHIYYNIFLLLFLTTQVIAQESNATNFLRDRLMVYYVEDPSSDQYRLLNPGEMTTEGNLFGGNPQMETAQLLIRAIFSPRDNQEYQQTVIETLRNYEKPVALFLYSDEGPIDEAIASENWTNCIESGHFTSCVTIEPGDEYAGIVHYGSNQMSNDGVELAKNRLLSLLNLDNNSLSETQNGITLTFYTNYVNANTAFTSNSHAEFERYAKKFSKQHNAIALNGQNIINGENAAIPVLTVQEIIDKSTEIIMRLRETTNNPSLKIQTLAILTHGLTNYVNFGNHNIIAVNETVARQKNRNQPPDAYETAETFANGVHPILTSDGSIILYACLSGSSISDDVWENRSTANIRFREQDFSTAGDGSIAKEIKNHLNTAGNNRQVWAHRTTAHTVGNPVWRVFKGSNTSGRSYEDLPFIKHHPIFSSWGRNHLTAKVNELLHTRNFSTNSNDNIGIWIAQEIPFVPNSLFPLVTSEPNSYRNSRDYHFKEGLVEWYANRWISQNPNTPSN